MADITSERDKLSMSLNVEKKRVEVLKLERDQVKEKVDDLIECLDDNTDCRHCGWNFGMWVEDDDEQFLVRCNRCRTRHW